MSRPTSFLYWLLGWLWYVVVVGLVIGAIALFSFRAGDLTLGLAATLVACAYITIPIVTRAKAGARKRAALKNPPLSSAALRKLKFAAVPDHMKQSYAEALPALERATREQPDDPEHWTRLAYALNMLGRPDEALAASEHALHLDPNHASAWARKGAALTNLGRLRKGLAACGRALALDAQDATAWRAMGTVLARLERHKEALTALDRALALDPQYTLAWLARGAALSRLQRYQEALEAFAGAVALDPPIHVCLVRQGQRTE